MAGDFGQLEQEGNSSFLRTEQTERRQAQMEGSTGRSETPEWECIAEKARLEKKGPRGKKCKQRRKVRRLAGEKA